MRNFLCMLQGALSETGYSYLSVAFIWHNEQFCELCSLIIVINLIIWRRMRRARYVALVPSIGAGQEAGTK